VGIVQTAAQIEAGAQLHAIVGGAIVSRAFVGRFVHEIDGLGGYRIIRSGRRALRCRMRAAIQRVTPANCA
jgi:hypothetical protein